MGDIRDALTRNYAGLPGWAWVLALIGGILAAIAMKRGLSAGEQEPTGTTLPTGRVDAPFNTNVPGSLRTGGRVITLEIVTSGNGTSTGQTGAGVNQPALGDTDEGQDLPLADVPGASPEEATIVSTTDPRLDG